MKVNRSAHHAGIVCLICMILLALCGSEVLAGKKKKTKKKKAPKIVETFRYVPAVEGGDRQEIGDIAIEVQSLINESENMPEIFAFSEADIDAAQIAWKQITGDPTAEIKNTYMYPTDRDGNKWINILGHPGGEMALPAFLVKVKNNTDHILNFSKDAKVYFKDGLSDEPVAPLVGLDGMTQWLLAMEQDFDANRKKGILSFNYPMGITPSLFRVRFGGTGMSTFVDKDALPGFGASGLLLFPSTLGKAEGASQEIEVLFFEVPSETNEAGEITKRSRMTFTFKQVPVKYWYDKQTKRWIEGEPPQPGDL